MNYKLYTLLLSLFFCFSCAQNLPENQQINKLFEKTKLIYQFKDIMANEIAFIPNQKKIVIKHSSDALIVDFIKNIIIKKLPSPNPNDFIKNIKVFNNNLLLATRTEAQIWDLSNFVLLDSYKSKNKNHIIGISYNDRYLIFDNKIIDLTTKKTVMKYNSDRQSFNFDFSKNERYFVIDGHSFGSSIVDLKFHQQMKSIKEKGMKKIQFRDDNNFYAGYGAKILPSLGGYYPAAIGLYDIVTHERKHQYLPSTRISCWLKVDNDKIIAAQVNGNIELLNKQLKVEKKWRLNDQITTCISGKKNQVWLGSKKSGIYLINTHTTQINHIISNINDAAQLTISTDNKYLGVVKSVQDGSHINIYSILGLPD